MITGRNIEKDIKTKRAGVLLKDVIPIEYAKKAVEACRNFVCSKEKVESEE